jgi:hypothetical protein
MTHFHDAMMRMIRLTGVPNQERRIFFALPAVIFGWRVHAINWSGPLRGRKPLNAE